MKTHSGAKKRFRKTANGQAARPARLLEPHPREEVAEAQAPHGASRSRSPEHDTKRVERLLPEGRPMSRRDQRRRRASGARRRSSSRPRATGGASTRATGSPTSRSCARATTPTATGGGASATCARLWIIRINAAARREGMSYSRAHPRPRRGRRRGQPQDARRHRRPRPRGVPPICRASPGGRGGLNQTAATNFTGRPSEAPFFVARRPMITSKDNEKLKLIRKLAERKHREREGLFVAEGEDLVAAAEAAGRRARVRAARPGEDVEPELLDAVSDAGLGDAGDRRLPRRPGRDAAAGFGVYLHGVGDPGNVGAIIRTAARAAATAPVVLGPGCADPYSPEGGAGEHGLDLRPPAGSGRARALAGAGRRRWSPTAASRPTTSRSAALCLGGERDGPARRASSRRCDRLWTIPLRDGGRVAQRRGGGGGRPRTDIVGAPPDARADRGAARRGLGGDRRGRPTPPRSRSCGSATSAASRS